MNAPSPTYRYITNTEEAIRALGELPRTPLYALDTETTGDGDPYRDRIRLLQVASAPDKPVLIVDAFAVPLEALAPVLSDLRITAHNAVFDTKMLAPRGIRFRTEPECSLLLNHSLTGDMEGLVDLAKRELDIELSKELRRTFATATDLTPDQLTYAARDPVVQMLLVHRLRARAHAAGSLPVYRLMRGAQLCVVNMELAGMGFDIDKHRELMLDGGHRQSETLWELRRLGLDSPASPKKVASWIERYNPGSAWPRSPKGQLKTDAVTVRYLQGTLSPEGREAVKVLLRFRDATKLLSTYGTKFVGFVHPDTKRMHCQLLLAGTRTGRMACRNPNLQQAPLDDAFRECFVARPGYVYIVADYSQIELRVAAVITNEIVLLDAYHDGRDIHRETASRILNKPAEEVTKDERYMAKAINFGLLYGQMPAGFSRYAAAEFGIYLTEAESATYRNAWLAVYPRIREWQMRQETQRRYSGYVTTPAGRVRDLDKDKSPARAALNTPCAGGAAEVMLTTLGRLPRALEGLDATPVLVVHDELLVEVREDQAQEAAVRVECAMREGFLERFPDGPVVGLVDLGIGPTWAQAKH